MTRASQVALAVAAAAFLGLFFLHRDLSLTLGNTEWDYVGQRFNRYEGTIERSGSLRDALRPDGLYGQGYALATFAVRAVRRGLGVEDDAFRAAQTATLAFSLLFLVAALGLGRALGLARDLEWVPIAVLGCMWPVVGLAVQVTTDIPAAALASFAMIPLLSRPSARGGLLAGALLGLGMMVRTNNLSLLAVFVAIVVLVPAEQTPVRERARAALAICAGFLLGAAPRIAADLVQTGVPIYHEHEKVLRALLFEGGLTHFRDEPVGMLELLRRGPLAFARAFARSYAYYEGFLLPALALPLVLLLRDPRTRRRAIVALVLIVGVPLGASIHPPHAPRWILPLFPVPAALVAAALDVGVPERLRRILPRALAPLLSVVFALEVGIAADKYRFDVPEAEIRAALEATTPSASAHPAVLVRIAGEDRPIYFDAARFRLRRLGASLALAPEPIDAHGAARLGFAPPFFVLRLPIPKTGPSALLDAARGRRRELLEPEPDPCLAQAGAARVVHDPRSGIELWRVARVPPVGAGR